MVTKELLQEFVSKNEKLVTCKESTNYPGLFVIKYTRKVFYDALWNDILEECRGLVVDKDWNIVIHPFTKIYNRGENNTDMDLNDYVVAVKKVNGFMAAVTIVNGEPIVSTTGSLESDFIDYAKDKLGDLNRFKGYHAFTWIFEIVHEQDPHIISEKPGAYLIGMRDLTGVVINGPMLSEWKLDSWAYKLGVMRPEWKKMKFHEVVEAVRHVEHEGFVVRREHDDYTLKIKSKYYLTTKFFARISGPKLLERLDQPWLLKKAVVVEEEFFPLVDYLYTNRGQFVIMSEQERIDFIKEFLNATSISEPQEPYYPPE